MVCFLSLGPDAQAEIMNAANNPEAQSLAALAALARAQ